MKKRKPKEPKEPKPKEKPFLSPSQIGMFCRCGEAYRRRYICEEIIPPGFAVIKGTSVHLGSEANFKQKIETHEDLKEAEIVEIAAAGFDDKIKTQGVLLSAEEKERGLDVVRGEAKDSTVGMARLFAAYVAPKYQPVAVEEKVVLKLPGPRDLLGIIDLVTEFAIQDLKTGAKARTQTEIDGDPQFTIYAALYKAKYGKPPDSIIIDNIVDCKNKKVLTFETRRTKADFEAIAARFNTVAQCIETSSFAPTMPGAWWCSAKSCGYYWTCPYVSRTGVQERES